MEGEIRSPDGSGYPTGTVTFLLTDIEGSTRVLEQFPVEGPRAVARQREILAACVLRHRGVLPRDQGEGDSVFAAFSRAGDAIRCALAAQRILRREPWPKDVDIGVRIAIHTGEAELRVGNYHGLAVNLCARLRAIAHGGQTLVSQATYEVVRGSMEEDASLLPLGAHRLADLSRPENVFQLCHPSVPLQFPPLRSVDAVPNNLPLQLTSFVGRVAELEALEALLRSSRLLTLTGPGGGGKSRLALQTAAGSLDENPDGVFLVELAGVAAEDLVVGVVASAIGIREERGLSLLDTVRHFVADRRLLMILDNCEHLIEASAELVEYLLTRCPNLRILTTSRRPLGVAGETVWSVPTMSTAASPYADAVALFVERARAVRPGYALNDDTRAEVADLCRRVDGIPLAIELAAARVRVMTPRQIAARLRDGFEVLVAPHRTPDPRRQTVRATMDWSHELLSDEERVVFRRLAAFPGSLCLEAAEAVVGAGDIARSAVMNHVFSLVDQSLLLSEEHAGANRYRMLAPIRELACEKLDESPDGPMCRRRHVEWCAELVAAADARLLGPDQASWLAQLDAEHDNIRAALASAFEHDPKLGIAIAGGLARFWDVRGHWREGSGWLARAVEVADALADPAVLGKALTGWGRLAQFQGDYARAASLYTRALRVAKDAADLAAEASALTGLGNVAEPRGDYAEARSLYERGLELRRDLGDDLAVASSLNNLAIVAAAEGDFDAAVAALQEGLTIRRRLGHAWGVAAALSSLGNLAQRTGRFSEARAMLDESLVIRRDLQDRWGTATSLSDLAMAARSLGDDEAAETYLTESLSTRRDIGDRRGTANSLQRLAALRADTGRRDDAAAMLVESLSLSRELGDRRATAGCLEALAGLARRDGVGDHAAELLGAAAALRLAIGAPRTTGRHDAVEEDLSAIRAALGPDGFAAAFERGRTRRLEAVLDAAADRVAEKPARRDWPSDGP